MTTFIATEAHNRVRTFKVTSDYKTLTMSWNCNTYLWILLSQKIQENRI